MVWGMVGGLGGCFAPHLGGGGLAGGVLGEAGEGLGVLEGILRLVQLRGDMGAEGEEGRKEGG